MQISWNWLKRHVKLSATPEQVSEKLTSLGFEVEGVHSPAKTYNSLVVAKVLSCEAHPDSDHLHVTRVFDGQAELQVVCGAPNVAAGQTVVFAPVGTALPMVDKDGKEEILKLKKAKIRGVESFGMICATDEIGLGGDHSGILVLEDSVAAGTPFVDLGFYDTVFELNVTPNRPDALSHRGIARELGAAFDAAVWETTPPCGHPSEGGECVEIKVESPEACSRYVGRVIRGVRVAPSPEWLQNLLRAVGLTPINNVVDITNFVLMDIGQPLHSFDLGKLSGGEVRVRFAREGESITTIDHTAHTLATTDLVICDGDRPACVAGLMGGVESEITDETTSVFLESAYFDPTTVRKASKRLGLSSDSSFRFERGIDPAMQREANDYATALILELAGGQASEAVEVVVPNHKTDQGVVALRPERVKMLLGVDVGAERIEALLSGIGITPRGAINRALTADAIPFQIPSWRVDLTREADLIEEVARLIGYDQIPYELPRFVVAQNELPPQEVLGRKIRGHLAALGLSECLSLRFTNAKRVEAVFGPESDSDRRSRPARLLNPLSEDLALLPTSCLPNLLHSVAQNLKLRLPGDAAVRLFEVAKAQFPAPERRSAKDPGFDEVPLLAFAVADTIDFAQFKGLLLNLSKRLSLSVELKLPEAPEAYLHPHKQAEVWCGKMKLGSIGEAHPQVLAAFEIEKPTYLCELDLSRVEKCQQSAVPFAPYSRQMPVTRDISLEVDARYTHAQAVAKIKGFNPKNLVDIELASVYEGDKLPAGKKNLLYTLTYQSADSTLTDEEVNKVHTKLREKLASTGEIALR
jgi:phenylalanyl-tRNA synthetase beta chain